MLTTQTNDVIGKPQKMDKKRTQRWLDFYLETGTWSHVIKPFNISCFNLIGPGILGTGTGVKSFNNFPFKMCCSGALIGSQSLQKIRW
jgi:hypothetical protein